MDDHPLIGLTAASNTSFWSVDTVRNWADDMLIFANTPKEWLIDVSLGQSQHDVSVTLHRTLAYELCDVGQKVQELEIGFRYIRYLAGDVDLKRMHGSVFQQLDAGRLVYPTLDDWDGPMDCGDTLITPQVRRWLEQVSTRAFSTLLKLMDRQCLYREHRRLFEL